MRTKEEINSYLINKDAWNDNDVSRKAHQLDILIEVLVDIRDLFNEYVREYKSFPFPKED